MTHKSEEFLYGLDKLFLLKDCYELIQETLEEDIELHACDFEEREGMLKSLEEFMDIISERMPKLVIKQEHRLRLVPNYKKEQ